MNPLAPAQLLDARDRCAGLHPVDRALVLLRIADPDSETDPALWPIAQRDRELFRLRRAMFGDRMECLADCPACGETQEFSLSASALLDELRGPPVEERFEWEGHTVTLRPLDSRDLAAAAHARSQEAAAQVLRDRAMAGAGPFDESVLAQIESRIEAREAAADIALDLSCPNCGHAWTDLFDIEALLGREVETSATQLLRELAVLATRFGWSERELLVMPASRRRAYLEMVA